MYNIPVLYDYMNTANSKIEPSTVHVKNTNLSFYFKKYLMQKAISVFDFKIPENWASNYFLYVLYCWGFIAVFDSTRYGKNFGIIPQACSFKGYNVFYQPTDCIVVNPLITGIKELKIGRDCSLIKLQPNYSGIMDIVSYYADLMALATEALGVNLLNSKYSFIFGAENQAKAESFKEMYDEVAGGQPAVFVDKKLFNEEGQPTWFTFSQDLKNSFLAPELLETLRTIETDFERFIGIPNANEEKKERLTSFDLKASSFSTCEIWLDTLKEGIKQTNDLFGLDLSVDWREELKNGETFDTGAI